MSFQSGRDRFERTEYIAATGEVRERVYAHASALGTILPEQRALAMRLVESGGGARPAEAAATLDLYP